MATTGVLLPSTRSRSTASSTRGGRAVLLAVAVVLLGSVAFKAYRLTLPTDGWSLLQPVELPIFDHDMLHSGSSLLPGDMLVGIDGIPYFDVIGAAVRGRAAPLDYRAGATSTYTVWRAGAEVEVVVPIGHWTLGGVARAAWRAVIDTPLGGIYLWLAWLIAAYVFYRRSDLVGARLLFVLQSVTLSMAISSVVAPVTVADALSPTLFYAARLWGDLASWLVLPPIALHFLLAFPAGLRVPRWTLVAVYGVPWVVFAVVWLTGKAVLVPVMSGAYSVANLVVVLMLIVRHASGEERANVRWLAYGFGVSSLLSLLFWLQHTGVVPTSPLLSTLLFRHCLCDLVYVACIAIALLRYRLFDIDVVIRRTLVYGGLTLVVVAVFAALVGGVGRMVGAASTWPLSLAATGVVALTFDPLRARLQRAVNRLVYGYRDEPYAVVARLGQRLESSLGPLPALHEAARSISEALRLPAVAIEVGGFTLVRHGVQWRASERFPLTRGSEQLGALVVSTRPGEKNLSVADHRLLETVAGQVATVVHALLLEADLERSRIASLNAREEARRRLGSDLHDDVGHRLTALAHRAERVRRTLDTDPQDSRRSLEVLVEEVRSAAARVRHLSHQLHPPELVLLGLVGATRERLQVMSESRSIRTRLSADAIGELPAAVELAAYSVIQEALSNVAKHSGASSCRVKLALAPAGERAPSAVLYGRVLTVEVCDDGAGFAEGAVIAGLGLSSMRARAHELGGTVVLEPAAGGGACLRLTVPVPDQHDRQA